MTLRGHTTGARSRGAQAARRPFVRRERGSARPRGPPRMSCSSQAQRVRQNVREGEAQVIQHSNPSTRGMSPREFGGMFCGPSRA